MSHAHSIDPTEHLARSDKWFLGGGDHVLFAPPFPLWLDQPGFWDDATVGEYAVGPLFTVTAVDGEGREIAMRLLSRRWTPAELTSEYRLDNGVTATEVRTLQRGVFGSEWRFRALRPVRLHLVAWTAQPASEIDLAAVRWTGALCLARTVNAGGRELRVDVELACAGDAESWAAYVLEAGARHPHWRLAPFEDRWEGEALPCELRLDGPRSSRAVLFAAIHRPVLVAGDSAGATFALRLTTPAAARPMMVRPTSLGATLGGSSRRRWQESFAAAPHFRCSDPYFETYYWYRWYGVGLLSGERGTEESSSAPIAEGVGALHRANADATCSAVRELRWLADPVRARGAIRAFLAAQRADGSLPAFLPFVGEPHGESVADWGDAILALDDALPDDAFITEVYPALARHARRLADSRDAEGSGMLSAEASEESMRKRVGDTVCYYRLLRALEQLGPRAGRAADVADWSARATRTARAAREHMWNAERQLFLPIDDRAGMEADANISADSLFPFLTDLALPEHLDSFARALVDPAAFGAPYPIASVAIGPLAGTAADAESADDLVHRLGRVRPSINSRVVQALGRCAVVHDPALRTLTAELLRRFVHMLFNGGDLREPNSYEDYDALTGRA